MDISNILILLGVICALWGVVDSILIAVALDRRGVDVNMVLFRLFFFRYLSQYRAVTKRETGKTGNLFYSFIISMNVALILVLCGILLKNLG